MKYRNLTGLIQRRLAEEKPLIQVLLGPRQVGKTTAVRAALENDGGIYESADFPAPPPHTIVEEWWKKAIHHPQKTLAIDEIQKITGWTEAIKRLWDASDREIKLVVTGSSSLLVAKGLNETLAGRFELIRAEHWNLSEAMEIFDLSLDRFVEFGCYPGAIPLLEKGIERWAQYIRDSIVEPALGRDLLQLHPVDQPALLRQIFGVAVSLPCQIVSLQKLQGQLQGRSSLPTIQNYLRLLADAFLVTGIEKYSTSQLRMRGSSPKLIIHDNGLVRAFERPPSLVLTPARLGHYFENAIGARLLEAGWDLFYWKDRDLEVDLVALGPSGEKWAIEVKTSNVEDRELAGLMKFCERNPGFEPHLVSLSGQKVQGVASLDAKQVLGFSRSLRR